jgi:hypothetical protein
VASLIGTEQQKKSIQRTLVFSRQIDVESQDRFFIITDDSNHPFFRNLRMISTDKFPPRISLANTPTPLQKMERLSQQAGVEIFFKRDDYTGSELSGNKVRKLEFIMADARAKGADTVLTCGGAQSNHCRATALAAVRAGLSSLLLLRTDDPDHPPAVSGNILLDGLAGAEIVWITPDQYRSRDRIFEREAQRLRSTGAHALHHSRRRFDGPGGLGLCGRHGGTGGRPEAPGRRTT